MAVHLCEDVCDGRGLFTHLIEKAADSFAARPAHLVAAKDQHILFQRWIKFDDGCSG